MLACERSLLDTPVWRLAKHRDEAKRNRGVLLNSLTYVLETVLGTEEENLIFVPKKN